MGVVLIHRVVGVDQGDIQLLRDTAGQEKGAELTLGPAFTEPMAVTPSRDQEWSDWDSVRIRTSWPRRSNSRCRFFTEVTTPFTAGVYQTVVIRIFITGYLLSSCSHKRRSPAERFNFRNIFSVPV